MPTRIPKANRREHDSDGLLDLILSEDYGTFAELVKEIPGPRKHVGCMYRWHHHGLRGRKLEAVRLAGVYLTSREALTRFFRATARPKR